jgi:hypothetical protein
MSNLFSAVSNYSGRQPDSVQNIKQFVTSFQNIAVWIYKRVSTTSYKTVITIPSDNDVLIPKNLYVNGTIFVPSDKKLKTNINEINDKTKNIIFELNPVVFEYINDNNKKKHYGLIAQEVEKIYPELVSTEVGYKTVNYNELIPIMLSKMKNMQEEINLLKEK